MKKFVLGIIFMMSLVATGFADMDTDASKTCIELEGAGSFYMDNVRLSFNLNYPAYLAIIDWNGKELKNFGSGIKRVVLLDVNEDGYLDIVTSELGNIDVTTIYLWDLETRNFELLGKRAQWSYVIFSKGGFIEDQRYNKWTSHGTSTKYKVEGNKLKKVSSKEW